MPVREGFKAYSLGQRRVPPRHSSARRKRAAGDPLRHLVLALRALAGERRTLAVASLPLLLLASMLAAYNLPWLQVTQVEIVGARALDAAQARATLRLEGKNILAIDAAMVEKVLRQHPTVREVTLQRQWPNKVVLQVGERRPFALWQTPEGSFSVDEEGYVLTDSPPPGPLPAIAAQEGGVRVGARVPQGVLALARDLAARLPAETGAQPRQFQYSAAQGLSVTTDQGWKAVFGQEGDLESKLAVLAAVLRVAKEKKLGFEYVDLRYGARPYLR